MAERPSDENLAVRIEKLAHHVAKSTGHQLEDYTRQRQNGNPDFDFLNSGEGSEYYQYCKAHYTQELAAEAPRMEAPPGDP